MKTLSAPGIFGSIFQHEFRTEQRIKMGRAPANHVDIGRIANRPCTLPL